VQYLGSFPVRRLDPAILLNHYRLDVGPDGTVYVVDHSNHRVSRFAARGEPLETWGEMGREEGRFGSLGGVKVRRDGSVIVSDLDGPSNALRVQKFDSRGQFQGVVAEWEGGAEAPDGSSTYRFTGLGTITRYDPGGRVLGTWGSPGTGPGQLGETCDIHVAPDGTVLVADTDNHRIQRFSPDGVFVGEWGRDGRGQGEFHGWLRIEPSGSDHVVVLDVDSDGAFQQTRIQKFTVAGAYVDEIPIPELGGVPIITDFAGAPDGSIYMNWQWPGWVVHLAADGTLLEHWGSLGGGSSLSGRISSSPSGDTLAEAYGKVQVLGRLGELKATIAYTRAMGLPSQTAVRSSDMAAGGDDSVWVIAGERKYRSLYSSTLSLDVARIKYDGTVIARHALAPYDEPDLDFAATPQLASTAESEAIVLDVERRTVLHLSEGGQLMSSHPVPDPLAGFSERLALDVFPNGDLLLLQSWQDSREAVAPPLPRATLLDRTGQVLSSWTFDEAVHRRTGRAADSTYSVSIGPDDMVYIAINRISLSDYRQYRGQIQAFTREGTLLGAWGDTGFSPLWRREPNTWFQPVALEATQDGRLLVTDNGYLDEPSAIRVFGKAADASWRAIFYRDRYMTGLPVAATSLPAGPLAVDWGEDSPAPALPSDGFAARLRGSVTVTPGTYRFTIAAHGGIRLWVGRRLLVDRWEADDVDDVAELFLFGGRHAVQLDYIDRGGSANLDVSWQPIHAGPPPVVLPWLAKHR
jgi:hypothetical protein